MRAIMGRALQIDSGRSERFTPEQLRTIAAELGISTQALEVAMYEADSKGVAPQFQQPMPSRNGWAKGVAIAVGVLIVTALGFGFMRMTVGGRDVPQISEAPVPTAVRPTPRASFKTAPARAVKTSPPATTEPVTPAAGPVTKKPTTKVLPP
jgi:hypothetical protein